MLMSLTRMTMIAHPSCWFWNTRRVLKTMEELLPPRLALVLQVAALFDLTKVAVLVVPKAVGQVTEMLSPRRS